MAKLSKYFTPELDASQLAHISRLLGVTCLPIHWVERLGATPLWVQRWDSNQGNTLLWDFVGGPQNQSIESLENRIVIEHSASNKAHGNPESINSTFEKTVPFPYSFLFSSFAQNYSIEYQPGHFQREVELLQQRAKEFERELSRFELSVLWLNGRDDSFALLFHFVRRKLLRVGTLATLDDLVKSFKLKSLTPTLLRQFFGTNAAFYELKLGNFDTLDSPIQQLSQAFYEAVNDSTKRVLGETLANLETPTLLDFEL
jgi:hypothetical protein